MDFRALKVPLVTGQVERRTLDGREYLVAPVVLVREMVLNGGYLPANEIQDSTVAWNGRPITVNHPTIDGEFAPANQPQFLETQTIGLIFEAEFVNDLPETDRSTGAGVRAQAWVDEQRATDMGGEAAQIVKFLAAHADAGAANDDAAADHIMDVSTGYWHDIRSTPGQFMGQRYDAVQFDLHPDHLAFLPNTEGACSVADGCGVPRVQQALEGHTDEAPDDDSPEVNANVEDITDQAAAGVGRRMMAMLGLSSAGPGLEDFDVDGADGGADDVDGGDRDHATNCSCGKHGTDNMDINIDDLAEATAFDADELNEMDESTLAKLAETVEAAAQAAADTDPADDDGASADASTDTVPDDTDAGTDNSTDGPSLEDFERLLDDRLAQFARDQRADELDDAIEALTENTDLDEAVIKTLAEQVDDVDALVALAENVAGRDAQKVGAANGVNWLGRGAPSGNAEANEEAEDDHLDYVGNMGVLTRREDDD